MKTKQTIAVIGTFGNFSAAISKGLARGNYRLLLRSDDRVKVKSTLHEILGSIPFSDVEVVDCALQASWEADIIIAAVPYGEQKEIALKINEVANQKIVISIANPVNETDSGSLTSAVISAAEELQKFLPNSKVITAFSCTYPADFINPVRDGKRVDVFIAGKDKEALKTVSELVAFAGFNPVMAGDLSATCDVIESE